MDPVTRASQEFTRRLAAAFRRSPRVRLVAPAHRRPDLIRGLRLFERAPDNRWPVCVVEAPAGDLDALARAATERLLADLTDLRGGLAADGVALAEPAEIAARVPSGGGPLACLLALADASGDALARTGVVAGLALAFVPVEPSRRLAEALRDWPPRPSLRVALAAPDLAAFADLVADAAAFTLDDDDVHAYCQQQGERLAAAAPPAEASLRRHFLAATDAAHRGDLAAARRAFVAAGAELVAQGRTAEAALIDLVLGGICFGIGEHDAALGHFDRAALADSGHAALVTQALLGAGGILLARGDREAAGRRYEQAARSPGPAVLQAEAARLAASCRGELAEVGDAGR